MALGMPYCHCPSWNPVSGKSILCITISLATIGWSVVTTSHGSIVLSGVTIPISSATSTATAPHGLTTGSKKMAWPHFDPKKLDSETGRDELRALAQQYFKTTHDAIRRHDKHHLIFGDHYEANIHIAMPLIEAAKPYIDILSF